MRILIADDHHIVLEGISTILRRNADYEVVAKCTNGEQVLHRLKDTAVDLVIMDINMPRLNGMEVAERIQKNYPNIIMIALSMYKKASYVNKMLNAGVRAYLLKDEVGSKLLEAIQLVMKGKIVLSPVVQDVLQESKKISSKIPPITKREKEILLLISQGLTSKEISEKLFISTNTIQTHRKHLMSKFSVNKSATMVLKAKDFGII